MVDQGRYIYKPHDGRMDCLLSPFSTISHNLVDQLGTAWIEVQSFRQLNLTASSSPFQSVKLFGSRRLVAGST